MIRIMGKILKIVVMIPEGIKEAITILGSVAVVLTAMATRQRCLLLNPSSIADPSSGDKGRNGSFAESYTTSGGSGFKDVGGEGSNFFPVNNLFNDSDSDSYSG